jgi:hypothetical protein
MQEHYPERVETPSLWDRVKATGQEAHASACKAISHGDISMLWERTQATGRGVRDRLRDVVPNVDIDLPDVKIDVDLPGVDLPNCSDTRAASSG